MEKDVGAIQTSPGISIITTVYVKTNIDLFNETVKSVLKQTQRPHEWLVLAHGPVSDDLKKTLQALNADGSLRLFTLSENLGIQGGLRYCLQKASGQYILPLDADDLLSENAIEALSCAARKYKEHKIFYSDEDLLIGGLRRHPYLRPHHDPIHLRAHSFVWHCIMFDRQIGLDIGVYTNKSAEYAQDWDTMLRFEFLGMKAQLVPEILYHWRQHETSLSNSGALFEGSLQSVRSCLELVRHNYSKPENYDVQNYPIGKPGSEFYLRRKALDLPDILSLVFSCGEAVEELSVMDRLIQNAVNIELNRGARGVEILKSAIADSSQPYIMLRNRSIYVGEEIGFWQAIKHFESDDNVKIVSGLLSNRLGLVIRGCPVQTDCGIVDPIRGKSAIGVNEHMFNVWKAHCIDTPNLDFCLIKTDFLRDLLSEFDVNMPLRSISWLCTHYARKSNALLVFEPLMLGYIAHEEALLADEIDAFTQFEACLADFRFPNATLRRGLSRIISDSRCAEA